MSKSPSLRRIQADIRELALDPSDQYHASPLENDMFEWHFTIRGAKGTDFEGGIYHGRILLPPDYPFKPPHIMFLNQSGRFETNTKVCLSFSAYHPELWQPAWGIRLILEALISFLPTPADGAIGALDWSAKERKRLAKTSVDYCCPLCGKVADLLPKLKQDDGTSSSSSASSSANNATPAKPSRFAKEIEELQRLQMAEHQKKEGDDNKEKNDDSKEKAEEPKAEAKAEGEKEGEPPAEEVASKETSENETKEAAETKKSEQVPISEQEHGSTQGDTDAPNPPPGVDVAPEPPVVAPAQVRQALVAVAAHPPPRVNSGVWWLLDPLLQLIIVILSAICFLLMRKVQFLVEDLQALENE